jgi:hypothetical protein
MASRPAKKYVNVDTIAHRDGLIELRDRLTGEIDAQLGTGKPSSVASLARQLQAVIVELGEPDSHVRLVAIRDALNLELGDEPSGAAVASVGRQVQSVLGAIASTPIVSNVPDVLDIIAMRRVRRRAGNPMTDEELAPLYAAAAAEELRLTGAGSKPSKLRELEARRQNRLEDAGVE